MSKRLHFNLSQKLVLPVTVTGVLIVSGVIALLHGLKNDNMLSAGINTADALANQIKSLRSFYTAEIATRAVKPGMTLDYDYAEREGSLPLPATFTHALAKSIEVENPGTYLRLYSRYPFPHRAPTERYDDFELEALAALERDPETPFYRLAEVAGRNSLRYTIADRMTQQGCVDCHNSHSESPKTDWKLGDVRG